MPVRGERPRRDRISTIDLVRSGEREMSEPSFLLRNILGGWRRSTELAFEAAAIQQPQQPCPGNSTDTYTRFGTVPISVAGRSFQANEELEDLSPPASCSFLQAGQMFGGCQRVSRLESSAEEDWPVEIRVEDVNLEEGTLCGSSTWHLPNGKSPVVTAWEGEIIDNVNHTFVTQKWGATQQSDLKHWSKFAHFVPLRLNVLQRRGRCGYLREYSHIYMRWKEQCFLNAGEDCGLTIAGFYYVCLCRETGEVHGVYVDPHSTPNHHLKLQPCSHGVAGSQTFSAFQFR